LFIKKIVPFVGMFCLLTLCTVGCGLSKAASSEGASKLSSSKTEDEPRLEVRKSGDKNTLGVWWWNIDTIKNPDEYLNFLEANHVSEIYLCIDSIGRKSLFDEVRVFAKKAKEKGMRIAALTGDKDWINPDNKGFESYVNNFNTYQSQAGDDEKFYAMHLDVEPHQHSEFKDNRPKVMQLFADFVINKAATEAKKSNTLLEWDIPFWLVDEVKDKDGSEIILAELMAKYCDTLAVMSYRDTAKAMFDVSKEEIEYAKKYNRKIVLGAETKSSEGDNVSYMEEGKRVMYAELSTLKGMMDSAVPDQNYGFAIHQVVNWHALKNG